jgi:hypothetical protein
MTYDTSRLQALADRRRILGEELQSEVIAARSKGSSWQAIADALGCSKANAHKKYGPKPQKFEDLPLSDPLFGPLFLTPQEVDTPPRASTP